MTVTDFQNKWGPHPYGEKQGYQWHFQDLCALAGFTPPADPELFCFEKPVKKLAGTSGFADAWFKGHFGWEYKGPGDDLDKAYRQLAEYREALENPPLLVVSDLDRVVIHTNFPNTVHKVHEFDCETIGTAEARDLLHALFREPERLNPGITREAVTKAAADAFEAIADGLRERVDADTAAHFTMRLLFCLFAEDIGLLPDNVFTQLVERAEGDTAMFAKWLGQLFEAMAHGGDVIFHKIRRFNGSLFDDAATIELTPAELRRLRSVTKLDWAEIKPAIFGTLFERIIDPGKRSQRGLHYTSEEDIQRIIEPVLMAPLRREWAAVKAACEPWLSEYDAAGQQAVTAAGAGLAAARRRQNNLRQQLDTAVFAFHDRLREVRVLDPACGSGNFLYVSLIALKRLEREVWSFAEQWGTPHRTEQVGPDQLAGLEIEPYAAELAQIVIWIGYLQYTHTEGFPQHDDPILSPHRSIECRDAIVGYDEQGRPEAPEWPRADVIVGNPPFLGGKKLRSELTDSYVDDMFAIYGGRVPREADLCCYWFERAREQIAATRVRRAGLLATSSMAQSAQMLPVLARIKSSGDVFMAWADEPWVLDGAAVRISLIGFDDGSESGRVLDGAPVASINVDLTSGSDLSLAHVLAENAGMVFVGSTKKGPFDIDAATAAQMLCATNPSGADNRDVVREYWNGSSVTRGWDGRHIVDFGEMSEPEAARYEAPFSYVRDVVKPIRDVHRNDSLRRYWWRLASSVGRMWAAIGKRQRYIVTAQVRKHGVFVFLPLSAHPDHKLVVVASDEESMLGILQSQVHEHWSLAKGSRQEDRPVYTPTTCFETFPFPRPTDTQREAIAEAARSVDEYRQAALDADHKLTMTALYNGLAAGKRPDLEQRHRALDEAVLRAYGWDDLIEGLPSYGQDAPAWTEELLRRLLALNLERAAAEG